MICGDSTLENGLPAEHEWQKRLADVAVVLVFTVMLLLVNCDGPVYGRGDQPRVHDQADLRFGIRLALPSQAKPSQANGIIDPPPDIGPIPIEPRIYSPQVSAGVTRLAAKIPSTHRVDDYSTRFRGPARRQCRLLWCARPWPCARWRRSLRDRPEVNQAGHTALSPGAASREKSGSVRRQYQIRALASRRQA